MYEFKYDGGSIRQNNKSFKFLPFILTPDRNEILLFEALKKGFAQKGSNGYYASTFPTLKIMTTTGGFGIRKVFYSFFLRLGEGDLFLKIRPYGYEQIVGRNFFFEARGRFMASEEVKKEYDGTATIKFYTKQTYLTKQEIKNLVTVTNLRVGETTKKQTRAIRI